MNLNSYVLHNHILSKEARGDTRFTLNGCSQNAVPCSMSRQLCPPLATQRAIYPEGNRFNIALM